MQKNETLQLKCCLKQWAVCCCSFLSQTSLPWPPQHSFCPSCGRVEADRLTDLSRLAGTLAFLSKSIFYLCFQGSAGREGHAQCQFSVPLPVAHLKVLYPFVGSQWISNTQWEMGTCSCCPHFKLSFGHLIEAETRAADDKFEGWLPGKQWNPAEQYLWGLYCLWLQMLCTVAAHQGEITGYDSTKWIYFKYPSVYKNNQVG